MRERRDAAGVLLVLSVVLIAASPVGADISFVYDQVGRLVGVIDAAGDTAVYSYDAVGNLRSISRYASSIVSLIDFAPHGGHVGATVTISGTGFSPIAGQNSVAFNGAAATVVSSTATEIVATVPVGATTGAVVVTAPAGSATSPGPFTVIAPSTPSITTFTPTVGAAGTSVTVTGVNLEPVPTSNRLDFNITRAAVGSASATMLGTTVPRDATSGRLTVATPAGSAHSSEDFFVPPPGFTADDVVFAGRIAVDGSDLTADITPANKIGLVVFDGTVGQPVSLGVVQAANWDSVITIFRPDGATVLSQGVSSASRHDLHIGSLPVSGTYTILLDVVSSGGTDRFTLTLSQDLPPVPISIGGADVTLSIVRPAQRAPLTFSGRVGQRLSLGFTAAGFASSVTVLNPDGSTLLAPVSVGYPTAGLDLPVLPATGMYTILVDPNQAATGSTTITLSEEMSGAIAVGGAAVPLSITRPAQRARLTFSGMAGQRLDLGLTGSTLAAGTASILDPDGTLLASVGFGTTNGALDTPPLPVAGTYTVLIDPISTYVGDITLTLSQEVARTIKPGKTAVSISLTRAGQRARLTFNGTANQRVSVNLTGVTIPQYTLSIVKPDGSILASTGTPFLEPQTLPTAGTYAVLLDPAQAYTGNATVALYDVPADLTASLTINGSAFRVTIKVPGQQAYLTFAGTSGQAVTVRGANNTVGCVNVYLHDPAGGGHVVISPCAASFTLPRTLTQTGKYTIQVDPVNSNVGSVDVRVTSP